MLKHLISRIVKYLGKYLILILPIILISKSLYGCYINDTWSFMYFLEYFLSHVPFFGSWLLNYFYADCSLTPEIIKSHQYIGDYIFIGSISAFLGNIVHEIWYDSNKLFIYMDNIGNRNAGFPQLPVPAQPPVVPQPPVPPFAINGGMYNVSDPIGMSLEDILTLRQVSLDLPYSLTPLETYL